MPMFPDSGVPPGEAINSLPDVNTAKPSDELWYSTSRCQPRFDPAAANAMLAEDMNLIMRAELQYDSTSLDHIERAVRYINQRGLPRGAVLNGGTFDYTFTLDPIMTRYNDFMTLTVIPAVDNQGAVRLNGGLGWTQLLRNDSQQLQAKDLRAGVPCIIAYWSGSWYHVGLCASQVPIVAVGAVDVWIRTDGNDNTGDGSANDPAKAFRTINGAWAKVGSRYASTPLFTINMRFGIPGDYEAGNIGNFGGGVTLNGDINNRAAYRIVSGVIGPQIYSSLTVTSMTLTVVGCTLARTISAPNFVEAVRIGDGTIFFTSCNFDTSVPNPNGGYIDCIDGSWGLFDGATEFLGRDAAMSFIIQHSFGAVSSGILPIGVYNATFRDCLVTTGTFALSGVSVLQWNNTNMVAINCRGPRYAIAENSILNMNGHAPPGSLAGTAATGAQYIP